MFLKGLKKTAEHFLNHFNTGRVVTNKKIKNENHKLYKGSADSSNSVII